MAASKNKKPIVLVIAGHDPSGGAGIQADIESIANAGCHAVTVITSLTAQNTNKITNISSQDPGFFRKQIKLIFDDFSVAACKIGMIGDVELVDTIHNELSDIKIPIILDPIINSGTGKNLSSKKTYGRILTLLLPLTTVITPNTLEAKILTGTDNLKIAADKLLSYGAKSVLITGSHEKTNTVLNTLYEKNGSPTKYKWKRLASSFHGSGCTLSSRIAANIALGNNLKNAVEDAQEYTWQTLKNGLELGKNQIHPDRFFNMENDT
mgnify:CR=1 FL=1